MSEELLPSRCLSKFLNECFLDSFVLSLLGDLLKFDGLLLSGVNCESIIARGLRFTDASFSVGLDTDDFILCILTHVLSFEEAVRLSFVSPVNLSDDFDEAELEYPLLKACEQFSVGESLFFGEILFVGEKLLSLSSRMFSNRSRSVSSASS